MNFIRNFIVFSIIFLLVLPRLSIAKESPNYKVNRAVSGVMQDAMTSRGYARLDPKYHNTMVRTTNVFGAAAAGAAGVTVGAVTAPAWVSILLVTVVSAAVGYLVTMALDSLTDWLFRPDGKIDLTTDPVSSDKYAALVAGKPYWKSSRFKSTSAWDVTYGGDGLALAYEADRSYRLVSGASQRKPDPSQCTFAMDVNKQYVEKITCGSLGVATLYFTGSPYACPEGQFWVAGACSNYGFTEANGSSQTGVTLQKAVDSSTAEFQKPLNPAIIAKLANQAWEKAASMPGYDGVPYQISKPITATDVETWTKANPNYAPTVGDFLTPNPVTTDNPYPWALPDNPTEAVTTPATTPNTGTTNPSTQPQENLGPDPNIGAPTLEQTPTAQMILDPVLNLMPSLKNFSPSVSSGICPRPSFTIFAKAYVLESHCTLFEENRSVISAAMILAFSIMALFIVLSA